jgi:hypothetical protein
MSGYKVRAGDAPSTLLSYVMFTSPDPLQASAKNTLLTLVVSNPGGRVVTVTRIDVTLPVGTNAKDLTADATGVQTGVPAGWQAAKRAGTITLTPSGAAGQVGAAGLAFTFASVDVNAQVGLCTVTIDETASSPSRAAQEHTATIDLPKFPAQFSVGDLQASPLEVPSGGSTTLMWRGSGPPASYTLRYQPANGGPPVSVSVGSTGPYLAPNLTRSGQVTFTLVVQVPVPGLDQPLTVERQVVVVVETLSAELRAAPLVVGVNGLARLSWSTSNAASCTLDPGGLAVPASGTRYVVVPHTGVFTLTARDAAGNEVQQQRTVSVDPRIVPNAAGHEITGAPGTRGSDGEISRHEGSSGGDGTAGGNAVLAVALPPLDTGSAPRRVISISLVGGDGGRGGDGGCNDEAAFDGGNGGPGGNATLTATFDAAAGPPAQYVVRMAAGKGGEGGQPVRGDGHWHGWPGNPGPNGTLAMTFDGVP